jgi:hypothetical protein
VVKAKEFDHPQHLEEPNEFSSLGDGRPERAGSRWSRPLKQSLRQAIDLMQWDYAKHLRPQQTLTHVHEHFETTTNPQNEWYLCCESGTQKQNAQKKRHYEPPGDTRTHIAEKCIASNIVFLDALQIIDQLKVTSAGIHVVGSL